ncbi:Interleukin-1 receptor type 2 [Camelus dromedarius]|uniref:Interleukin-1 receptor type 2 n=1 Tax=Camelus dromedarius TaxID=9838 RepID=A0A5N4CET2_CAMDR|nr:Interleukin-1 receptor type 2 [Camelus dromedarius]
MRSCSINIITILNILFITIFSNPIITILSIPIITILSILIIIFNITIITILNIIIIIIIIVKLQEVLAFQKRMKERALQKVWGAGPEGSTSCVLQKFLGAVFILCMLVTGVSAFIIQPEERTVAAGNCQFRGKHVKTRVMLEGEPVAIRCPQLLYWDDASAHINMTWRKNESAVTVPGEEEARVWVQDGVLWIVPASRGDSGTYTCTLRNASYCDEMSVELRVLEKTEVSRPLISYPQILPLSSSGMLVCPDLSEFIRNKTDVKIQWYKDSVPLEQDNKKFLSVKVTSLLMNSVSEEDAGYYSCVMTFAHGGKQYSITRNIKVRVNKREEAIPVIISPQETISASLEGKAAQGITMALCLCKSHRQESCWVRTLWLQTSLSLWAWVLTFDALRLAATGSRLTIPCVVFLGAGMPVTTMLWWMANSTQVKDAYQGGRVTEGPRKEYSQNNENYIEVPLIFDPVIREDLHTNYKCVVSNTAHFQTLRTTVKEGTCFGDTEGEKKM